MKAKSAWTDLGKQKLGSSGLTTKIAEQLGMYEVVSAAQLHDSFMALPALVIPYHDLEGKPASARPGWPAFYRVRYLAKGNTFKDLATDKSQRYAQPPGSGICAYFARTLDWKKIAKDATQGVTITEGEFKAQAACEMGYPCIGLGGVWNFMAQKEGVFMLPELEKFNWRQRKVFICFDSDYAEKSGVCQAIMRLAEELEERGAIVHVLLLPDVVENNKTGLDDFFLERSTEDFDALLDNAELLGLSRALWRINDEVIYVEDPGLVVVESTGQKMAPSQFKEHSKWATANYACRSLTKDGDLIVKKEPAGPAWIRWPLRRSARAVTYAPGQARITDNNEFNQWPGWAVAPKKGDITPFLDLINFLFTDADKGAKEWFFDWLAFPLQNPGVKMYSGVLIWGPVHGTGKSLIGYTMGEIYGKNFKEITDEDLEGGYTSWAENKQFCMGDEITGTDNRQFANMLKRLVTQRTMTINIKFVPQYTVPDCINYLFTSNHPDAFFLEDTDRRTMVTEVTADAPLPQSFYTSYAEWLWKKGGAAALMHWLLERKFTKNPGTGEVFNPAAHAFSTRAKDRMALSSKGELAAWVHELKSHPDQVLMFGQVRYARDLFTSKELVDIYKSQHPDAKPPSPVGLARALAQAGFPQMDGGQPLRGVDGKLARFYAVRNVKIWRGCKERKAMEKNINMQPIRGGK